MFCKKIKTSTLEIGSVCHAACIVLLHEIVFVCALQLSAQASKRLTGIDIRKAAMENLPAFDAASVKTVACVHCNNIITFWLCAGNCY